MTLVAHTLGTRLKAERENRGFTLAQVSSSTKIPVTLLDALERDDLSRWPKGLYRRAFFRSYVTALGLCAEPLVLEFTREFPDDVVSPQAPTGPPSVRLRPGDAAASQVSPHPPSTELALSWAGPSTTDRMLRSAGLALIEVAGVAGVAGVIAWFAGMQLLAAIGAVAVVYYPAARVVAGRRRTAFLRARRAAASIRSLDGTVPQLTSEPPALSVPAADPPAQGERWQAVAAGLAATAGVVSPVIGRTGQLLKVAGQTSGRQLGRAIRVASVLLIRSGGAAGREFGQIARDTGQVSWRAFDRASRLFWNGVRSAAEHAALLARRQLNRTRE